MVIRLLLSMEILSKRSWSRPKDCVCHPDLIGFLKAVFQRGGRVGSSTKFILARSWILMETGSETSTASPLSLTIWSTRRRCRLVVTDADRALRGFLSHIQD